MLEEKENKIFELLKEGQTYDYITERCNCSKSVVSEVKRKHPELFKIKKIVKEPEVKKDIITILTSGKPVQSQEELRNEWNESVSEVKEEKKESLDVLDYDIIKKALNKSINQLKGKQGKNPETSSTGDYVSQANQLKEKLFRMGLIR